MACQMRYARSKAPPRELDNGMTVSQTLTTLVDAKLIVPMVRIASVCAQYLTINIVLVAVTRWARRSLRSKLA